MPNVRSTILPFHKTLLLFTARGSFSKTTGGIQLMAEDQAGAQTRLHTVSASKDFTLKISLLFLSQLSEQPTPIRTHTTPALFQHAVAADPPLLRQRVISSVCKLPISIRGLPAVNWISTTKAPKRQQAAAHMERRCCHREPRILCLQEFPQLLAFPCGQIVTKRLH